MSRKESLKGAIFAENSISSVPVSPQSGTTYRKSDISENDIAKGWPFNTICNSAEFNEIMFRITSMMKELEEYGILEWSQDINYQVGAICFDQNKRLVRAIKVSGPDLGGVINPYSSPDSVSYWTDLITASTGGVGGSGYDVVWGNGPKLLESNQMLIGLIGGVTHRLTAEPEEGAKIKVVAGKSVNIDNTISIVSDIPFFDQETTVVLNVPGEEVEFFYDSEQNFWYYIQSPNNSSQIGEIFAYPSSLPPAGAFLLNGQTIPNCQETYKEFWNWLTSQIGEYETVSIYKPWTQVPLTADGTMGGSDYAVEPSGTIANNYPAWKSFDMTAGGANSVCAINTATAYLTYYSPVKLRINTVRFVRATTSMTNNRISSYIISGSNDNLTWTELASGDWTNTANSATLNINIDSSKYSTNRFYKYYKFYATSGGTNITEFPEIYLFGEEFVRTMQESNGYIRAINAEGYEAEIAEYGACGAFVVSGSNVRLPNLSNAFIQGSNGSDIGKTMGAGLPNITGDFSLIEAHGAYIGANILNGAFTGENVGKITNADGGYETSNSQPTLVQFDASLSNDTYSNSDTVQPLSAKYSICIQVFNTATDLSEQESAQLASQMQMKAQKDLGNVEKVPQITVDNIMPDTMDYVVESWNDEQGNWYRVYKSGWVEQGGVVSKNGITITLFKPFASDNYNICICANKNSSSSAATNFYNRTTTSFYAFADVSAGNACWQASGQGAN